MYKCKACKATFLDAGGMCDCTAPFVANWVKIDRDGKVKLIPRYRQTDLFYLRKEDW